MTSELQIVITHFKLTSLVVLNDVHVDENGFIQI